MRRWSISTKRKLRAMRRELEQIGDAAHHGALAAGRHGGRDQRVVQFVGAAESRLRKRATALKASSGRRAAPLAVTTSARALAYRVATAESVISVHGFRFAYEPSNQGVLRCRESCGRGLSVRPGPPPARRSSVSAPRGRPCRRRRSPARRGPESWRFPRRSAARMRSRFGLGSSAWRRPAQRCDLGLQIGEARDPLRRRVASASWRCALSASIMSLRICANGRRKTGRRSCRSDTPEPPARSRKLAQFQSSRPPVRLRSRLRRPRAARSSRCFGAPRLRRRKRPAHQHEHPERQALHAALRRRMDSAIWLASTSLSRARLALAGSTSAASAALACARWPSARWRALPRTAPLLRSCNCLCSCS